MHVHIPKPTHGWQAFLNEIFIIVIGVLIALGFQALVEEVHWWDKVQDGRERLRIELADIAIMLAEQIEVGPCVDAQLNRIERKLLTAGDHIDPVPLVQAGPLPETTVRMPVRVWPAQTWESLRQDDTSNHFPVEEQNRINEIYESVQLLRELTDESVEEWGALRIAGYKVPLTPQLRADVLRDMWKQQMRSRSQTLIATQVLASIRALGLAPTGAEIDQGVEALRGTVTATKRYCQSAKLPIADWRTALAVNSASLAEH